MIEIKDQIRDEERAFYHSENMSFTHCQITGPKDGESAFKESKNILVNECFFNLRYPFWHNHQLVVTNSEMTEATRAALWYDDQVKITDSKLNGIKALRECNDITLSRVTANSDEFGWFCRTIDMNEVEITSSYVFLYSKNITAKKLKLTGKYSFQYIKDSVFEDCYFDTKDAFWESENVTVKNSVIKGEYLAWYAKNLTLDHCTIIGTQPLCYCENLTLIDCEMIDCDFSFEYSSVKATLSGFVKSIKNPLDNSTIVCDTIGEIILDEHRRDKGNLEIIQKKVA